MRGLGTVTSIARKAPRKLVIWSAIALVVGAATIELAAESLLRLKRGRSGD